MKRYLLLACLLLLSPAQTQASPVYLRCQIENNSGKKFIYEIRIDPEKDKGLVSQTLADGSMVTKEHKQFITDSLYTLKSTLANNYKTEITTYSINRATGRISRTWASTFNKQQSATHYGTCKRSEPVTTLF